jgi:hypothetical protein
MWPKARNQIKLRKGPSIWVARSKRKISRCQICRSLAGRWDRAMSPMKQAISPEKARLCGRPNTVRTRNLASGRIGVALGIRLTQSGISSAFKL